MIDNFSTFKKTNKFKLKLKSKPWITPGLQKSTLVENEFLSDFLKKKKNSAIKVELHLKCKKL